MSKDDESNEDENKRIFEENFAPFHGRSKWVMIIIFSLVAFYIIASNLNYSQISNYLVIISSW